MRYATLNFELCESILHTPIDPDWLPIERPNKDDVSFVHIGAPNQNGGPNEFYKGDDFKGFSRRFNLGIQMLADLYKGKCIPGVETDEEIKDLREGFAGLLRETVFAKHADAILDRVEKNLEDKRQSLGFSEGRSSAQQGFIERCASGVNRRGRTDNCL